jgi:NAD(P)-dependent dehydrogenase (short-subunit alcohol dehydrogenase family)
MKSLLNPLIQQVNKHVCISGCSKGLGRAMAKEFAARGWIVTGGARNITSLEKLKSEISTEHLFHQFDITSPEQVEVFSELVISQFGTPDLLINNAGVINQNAPLTQVSPVEFANVLSVNLGGIHNMIRSFVPQMEKSGKGIIVNFSSYWGQSTAAEVGPYCTTKWGVEGLTRSLAQELPSGLATVAFNPGIINTDMLRSTFGEQANNYETPDEWVGHAVNKLENLSISDSGKTILG